MTATRRLAAILAADIAGYSRLIGADEGEPKVCRLCPGESWIRTFGSAREWFRFCS